MRAGSNVKVVTFETRDSAGAVLFQQAFVPTNVSTGTSIGVVNAEMTHLVDTGQKMTVTAVAGDDLNLLNCFIVGDLHTK